MKKLIALAAIATFGLAGAASAATYSVDNLINDNSDGFTSSLLHQQDYDGDMSGTTIANFDEAVLAGGIWAMDGSISFAGTATEVTYGAYTYSASGILNTVGAGFLTFDFMRVSDGDTSTITFHFADADYGSGPANGFDGSVISLWGQTGDCGALEGHCLGMDLRIAVSELTDVPLPATSLLLIGGIGAIAGLRRKRRTA